jgi:hypothetical protein
MLQYAKRKYRRFQERNTGKSAGLPLCSITKEYGVTHFTELHRTYYINTFLSGVA